MKIFIAFAVLLFAAAGFAASAAPMAPAAALKGVVLEVRDVDIYTYLRLKTQEGETWAAVTKAPFKTGAQVSIDNPTVMRNFESKTLNKTFDKIVFGTIAGPTAPAAAAQAMPHGGMGSAMMGAAATPAPVKVAKASGADARTVAEVVAGKAALKDKSVSLRGQVVKVSAGIMGKNWLHLQDGSGTVSAGSHDVIVTSTDTAAVGDVVTVKGTVRTDVKIGPGYAYAVLIDGATLRK